MLDIIVCIVFAFGFYLGFQRGIIKTVFDSLSIVVAILATLKLSPLIISIFQGIFSSSPKIAYLLGIVFTFIGVIFLVRYVGKKIESLLETVHINFVNKIMGGGLQALFFAFILSLFVWLVNAVNLISPETKEKSITYSFMEALPATGKAVFTSTKPLFQTFWDKTSEAMDSVKKVNSPGKTE